MIEPLLDLPLIYSSPRKQKEYRGSAMGSVPRSALSYDLVPLAPSSTGKVQARFENRLVLKPRLSIRGNYSVRAVIDRMILLVTTRKVTSWNGIQAALARELDVNTYVSDRIAGSGNLSWRGSIELPAHVASYGHGQVFALLVQDPSPGRVAEILSLIDSRWQIQQDVELILLELALDVYARRTLDRSTRLQRREQMVGLMQRHHGCEHEFIMAKSDARQVYEPRQSGASAALTTDFLFSSPSNAKRTYPDSLVTEEVVRKRLKHGQVGNQLFLDSTLYKGSELENVLFRIQHKIADERDPAAGAARDLSDEERRARIEVEISGKQQLAGKLGLSTVEDLKGFRFRNMRQGYLSFWLPTTKEAHEEIAAVRKQFTERGLYGAELREKLKRYEAHSLTGRGSRGTQRDRRGMGTTATRVAWTECNNVVGDALDALTKEWRRFTWERNHV